MKNKPTATSPPTATAHHKLRRSRVVLAGVLAGLTLPLVSPAQQAVATTAAVMVGASTGTSFADATPWSAWGMHQTRIADVNGDGRADIVGRNLSNSEIWVGLSTQTSFANATRWSTWSTAYDFHLADVNGDGRDDIIGRNPATIDVQVGLSTGARFNGSTQWASWSTSHDMHFADVNGDGRDDIVGRNPATIDVQVGLSTGARFNGSTQWASWSTSYDMQFADVNADGRDDIVGRNPATIDVQVGLSTGARFNGSTQWASWSTSYDMQFADVNGDGRDDIIGHSRTASRIVTGLSNGSKFASSTVWSAWAMPRTFVVDTTGDGRADIIGTPADRTVTPPPTTVHGLNPGETLECGQQRTSSDRSVTLVMQCDGNLVQWRGSSVTWAAGTNGLGGTSLTMQPDGNLVIFTSTGRPVWASHTNGSTNARLAIQNDGNTVIYTGGGAPIWDTFGNLPASTIGGRITRAEMLRRAQYWVTNPPPYPGYNQSGSHVDPAGKTYRADCSGYVSMVWHLDGSPTTVGFGTSQYTQPISKDSLRPGDIMNVDQSGNAGHVRIFLRWNDAAKTSYHYIDFGSGAKPAEKDSAYPGAKNRHSYEPRRYNNVLDFIL